MSSIQSVDPSFLQLETWNGEVYIHGNINILEGKLSSLFIIDSEVFIRN